MNQSAESDQQSDPFRLRWTFRRKASAIAAILISCLIAMGAFFLSELKSIEYEIEKITYVNIPLRKVVQDIETHQFEQRLLVWDVLRASFRTSERKEDIEQESIGRFENEERVISQAIEYGKQLALECSRKEPQYDMFIQLLDELQKKHQDFETGVREVIRLAVIGNWVQAEESWQAVAAKAKEVDRQVEQLLIRIERFTESSVASAHALQITAIKMSTALGFLAIFIGVLFSVIVIRKWTKSVAEVSDGAMSIASAVAHGIPNTRKLAIRSSDEIGNLCHAFNQMTDALIRSMTERKRAREALWKAHDELEKRVEERTWELKEANERLRELDEMKSDFVSLSWHELKTPLTSIHGYVALLLKGKGGVLTERQKRFLTYVQNKAEHLHHLINSLLNLSKLEAKQIDVKLEPVDVKDLIQQEAKSFQARAGEKQIGLQLEVQSDLKKIYCEPGMIRSVTDNLISNALKFTPRKGSIYISAGNADDGIWIKVQDTGLGIQEEMLEKIFEPFQSVHQAGTDGEQGSGLGLSLVKRIVETHRGDIRVSSFRGSGSTFTIALPQDSRMLKTDQNHRTVYAMKA